VEREREEHGFKVFPGVSRERVDGVFVKGRCNKQVDRERDNERRRTDDLKAGKERRNLNCKKCFECKITCQITKSELEHIETCRWFASTQEEREREREERERGKLR
jgi:hypothetical protein